MTIDELIKSNDCKELETTIKLLIHKLNEIKANPDKKYILSEFHFMDKMPKKVRINNIDEEIDF